jgi:hypothetical protein
MKTEYRIKEFCGKFTIQIKDEVEIECGSFWHREKKKVKKWFDCTPSGHRCYPSFNYALEPYKSLKKAQQKIECFKKGITYHSCQ